MRIIFALLFALLTIQVQALDLITLTVTVTNAPTINGMTLVVNGDTRTWTNNISADPSKFILTNLTIGGSATNLFDHVSKNPFISMIVERSGTDGIKLLGAPGQSVTASAGGSWASLTFATNTLSPLHVIRVPMSAIPVAAERTNSASLLVTGLSDYSTNKFSTNATSLLNYIAIDGNHTIDGIKTFRGANIHSNSNQRWTLGVISNTEARQITLKYYTNNGALYFATDGGDIKSAITPDSVGKPGLWLVNSFADEFTNAAGYVPSSHHLLNWRIATNSFGQLAADNTWTKTNSFKQITNAFIIGATVTNSTFYGTAGLLTNGTFYTPTLKDATNTGNSFQSYNGTDTTTLQIGKNAVAIGTGAISIGNNSTANKSGSIAIGDTTIATNINAIAIGVNARTTKDSEIRIGTANENISAPGSANIGNNLAIGDEWATFPTSLAKGLYVTNGTAATANPANGFALWTIAGALQYRSSATDEGAGQANHFHNRASQITGTGANYPLTTAHARVDFGGQDPEVTLPSAGTYLVTAIVSIIGGNAAAETYASKLFNATAAADVANSHRVVSNVIENQTFQIVLHNVVTTATINNIIQVYARNETAAKGNVKSIETSINYVRLH